jgi:DNA replication protein DnaC
MGADFVAMIDQLRRAVGTVSDDEAAAHDREVKRRLAREDMRRRRDLRRERLRASELALDEHDYGRIVAADLGDTLALEAVKHWSDSRTPALVLLGGVGVGKSVAAGWAIGEYGGHAITAAGCAKLFGSSWSTHVARWDELLNAPLIVVEELGQEDPEKGRPAFFELMNERQRMSRRTLFLGNLSTQQARSRFDARTLSRLDRIARFLQLKSQQDLRSASANGGGR